MAPSEDRLAPLSGAGSFNLLTLDVLLPAGQSQGHESGHFANAGAHSISGWQGLLGSMAKGLPANEVGLSSGRVFKDGISIGLRGLKLGNRLVIRKTA